MNSFYKQEEEEQPLDFSKSSNQKQGSVPDANGYRSPPILAPSPARFASPDDASKMFMARPFKTYSLNLPLPMAVSPDAGPYFSEEDYLKFREDMLKKRSQENPRRRSSVSNYSPYSNHSSPSTSHHNPNSQSPPEPSGSHSLDESTSSSSPPNEPSSGRKKGKPLPDSVKDAAYWERRRKNNEAAKRSRDARRAKEDEIAIRAAFLEQENVRLKNELACVKKENQGLKFLLYNTTYDMGPYQHDKLSMIPDKMLMR